MCICLDSTFEIILDKFHGLEVVTSCEATDAIKPSRIDECDMDMSLASLAEVPLKECGEWKKSLQGLYFWVRCLLGMKSIGLRGCCIFVVKRWWINFLEVRDIAFWEAVRAEKKKKKPKHPENSLASLALTGKGRALVW